MSLASYIKIHDQIKKDIEKGVWQVGQRLPSERDLAKSFKVSRATLRQAVTSLVDEGFLARRAGSGTFVVGNRVREKMRGTTSFTDIIKGLGKTPVSRLISYTKCFANQTEREKLSLPESGQIIKMERIRYADDLPICFEITCIPYDLISDMDKSEVTAQFFKTLEENGKAIGRSEQTISSKNAGQDLADYLEIKLGDAILAVSQVSYLVNEQPFEFVLSSYVGERFEFYLER